MTGLISCSTEVDALRRNATEHPEKTAIIFGDRHTNFDTLNRRASQIANGLLSLDATPQKRIGLLSKNADYCLELLFGTAKARNVWMAINWRLTAAEIAQILADAEVDTIFVGPEFAGLLPELLALGANLRHTFLFDANYESWRDGQSATDPMMVQDADEIFVQLYTSGTTGLPKGVQISHRASASMRTIETSIGGAWNVWGPEEVAIVAMPNFHVAGTNWALQWLSRGGTLVVQPQIDPVAMLDAVEKQNVTQLFAVPTVLGAMLDDPTVGTRNLSSLKLIHYGAAPMSIDLLERAMATFDVGFVQHFGMTEANGCVTVLTPDDHDPARPQLLRSVGRPYPAIELQIRDSDGNAVKTGTVGEIYVRTPALMTGYWKKPEDSADVMHGLYYQTGDAGYVDTDGYLFLVDRIKDMIVTGGENVYPIEVEQVLLQHPAVVDVAVIGIPDARWGEAVMAVVTLRHNDVDSAELIAFTRERIASFKAPKFVEFMDFLPRNPSGKLLKRELRKRFASTGEPV
ncbi:long-chain-fatty-acid--CoA ligase [Parasphingorhabdus sp.]|uniref:long-chain-fatty-acid--CoA ligase n=1 Tax=Parasphingorhabdus sp. TaxID=2709688 RepID=UPI0032F091D6